MNKLILLLSALTIIAASCTKRSSYRESAQIIGYDATMCECCGGYMVKTSEDKTNTYYVARTLPASAGINPNSTFPIQVEIDYDKNDKNCEKVITVTRLEKK